MLKKLITIVLIFGIGMTATQADKPVYTTGNYEGHGYEMIPTPTPWHIAKKKADEEGGYLVVITSSQENQFVTELVKKATKGEYCEVWIGLSDEKDEGDWKWINGEKYTFNNWDKSNPSNSDGAENSVQLIKSFDEFQWNDRSSDRRCAYIIEYNHEIESKNPSKSSGLNSGLRSTR